MDGTGVLATPDQFADAAPLAPDARGRRRTYAALDLGTNNCRLLIARAARDGFYIVDSFSRVVRLGEGLLASGRLSDASQDRAVAALAVCAGKIRRREVTMARSVATEACRRAANGARFIERVYAETGIALDVITAAEEARLAVLGCQTLLKPSPRDAIVFDIGGGSTEIALVHPGRGGAAEVRHWVSLPWGVISLAESEPTTQEGEADRRAAYARAHSRVAAALAPFAASVAPMMRGGPQLLGTSGTVTTLAALQMGLDTYDRARVDGCLVPSAGMRDIGHMLAGKSYAERGQVPTIGPDRADLIVAGCAILEAILAAFPAEGLRIADRGIREGILRTLIARDADMPA